MARLNPTATEALARWAAEVVANDPDPDRAARTVAARLGAHRAGEAVEFGIWVPAAAVPAGTAVVLELTTPPPGFDPTATDQTVAMDRAVVPMEVAGEYAWAVVEGVRVGDRDHVGTLYRAVATPDGAAIVVPDALAYSLPFGAFAPAEVVDVEGMYEDRPDRDHFVAMGALPGGDDAIPRLGPPRNILQVHVPTATSAGTIAGLTRRIRDVGERFRAGEPPAPADEIWLEYDAIQLMPVEPTIEYEAGPRFWEEDASGAEVTVRARRPDMTDWGYDVVISGSGTVNPALLETGRPHELVDLAAALHGFPAGPIRLIFDVVYGHADNQALGVLPPGWFTGPDMYGQHLDYRNPIVRAHLLEMQRRKTRFGADGLRVDGAQDFTWYDDDSGALVYDDRYMVEMSDVAVTLAGVAYRPWMIFEDGRPWPRDDWELASSYRAVTERQSHVVQWGPLTFAHNTPFLFTFWISKWWRLREVAEVGSHWISGCANHDTLRRGSQVDPAARINTYLGSSLPEVIRNAYDHGAANLLFHAFLPGIPMDFVSASARGPWSFIRTTDHRYAIKVWAEEARFLDWYVTAADYADGESFGRLKGLGFEDLAHLRAFMAPLAKAVELHGDAVEPVVEAMAVAPWPSTMPGDAAGLRTGCDAWMRDVHDYCNADRHLAALDGDRTGYNRAVRAFRRTHPWLLADLGPGDEFDYRHPTAGSVLFHGVRTSPDGSERVLFVATMEGAPVEVVPAAYGGPGEWRPALATPGVGEVTADRPVLLRDAQGVVFVAGT
jgi:hypothetical protein